MTIFGIIWIILAIFFFFNKDIKKFALFTLIGMLFQCSNVFEYEGVSCGPQIITSFLFIIKSYLYNYTKPKIKNNNGKGIVISILLLLIYVCLNSFYLNQFQLKNILSLLQIGTYIFAFIRFYKISPYAFTERDVSKFIKIISIFIVITGFISFFINLFGLNKMNLFQVIFFNDLKNTDILYFRSSKRFFATFMEPSYLSGLLVGLIIFYMFKEKKTSGEKILLLLLLISLILTFSTTAYVALFILSASFFIKNAKYKKTWLILFAVVFGMLLIGRFTPVFKNVVFDKYLTASSRVRNQLNNTAVINYKSNPLFGIGYKSSRASSLVFDLLANLGLVGLILYAVFVLNIIKLFFKTKNNYIIGGILIAISAIISQLISCPDLDLCSSWLALYLFAIIFNIKEEREMRD